MLRSCPRANRPMSATIGQLRSRPHYALRDRQCRGFDAQSAGVVKVILQLRRSALPSAVRESPDPNRLVQPQKFGSSAESVGEFWLKCGETLIPALPNKGSRCASPTLGSPTSHVSPQGRSTGWEVRAGNPWADCGAIVEQRLEKLLHSWSVGVCCPPPGEPRAFCAPSNS